MSGIGIAEFKSGCLKILQNVHETGIPVLITKRGKPLARVIPAQEEKTILDLKGSVLYQDDDIFSTGDLWEADS